MDAQMKRGFLEACVLATLDRRESYGYQIVKDVPLALGLTESTLYPLLKRLEAAGCIAVRTAEHNGRLRKYYRTTEEGKRRIAEFVAERSEVLAIYDYVEAATGRGATAQSLESEHLMPNGIQATRTAIEQTALQESQIAQPAEPIVDKTDREACVQSSERKMEDTPFTKLAHILNR
ncbi:PadR family transcriptional regulator [uncultured Slackia sp.]|uniref:PadR family transcriptional regulator n=1 Tax=uncultured Slackia sp. TaxID=665903 RepID=UPI0025F2A688|nr:PadR family transcriptional regulator [uncultured Slackia sp.]